MKKEIHTLLWDVNKQELVDLLLTKKGNGSLELHQLYAFLNCNCIDITTREIGGKNYDIIVDDEGLLKNDNKVSLIKDNQAQLVGNLIFTKHNGNGEERGMTPKEYVHLKKHLNTNHYYIDQNNRKQRVLAI